MTEPQASSKKRYVVPALTVYGNVENITKGSSDGNFLDNTYIVNTPKDQLTFSN